MCDDKFSSIQDLKKHFTRVHDGIEPTESDIEAENEAENIEAENSQDEMAEIQAENDEAELSLNEEDTDITEDQILHQGKGAFNNYVDKKRGRGGQPKGHACPLMGGGGPLDVHVDKKGIKFH